MTLEAAMAALLDARLKPLIEAIGRLTQEVEQLRRHLPRQLVRVSEAAEILGVHENTIRNWIKSGALPCRKIGGRVLVDIAAAQRPPTDEEVEA